jgi:hypothetical protein
VTLLTHIHRQAKQAVSLPQIGFCDGWCNGCDGFCDGSVVCKFFSINECDGVTGPDPWKASPRSRFWI